MEYLSLKPRGAVAMEAMSSDVAELKMAAVKLFDHAIKLGGLGIVSSSLKWVAAAAAIYLLVLDRTNWRTNMLTSLLVPYIFLTFPSFLFHFFRGEIGKWIAFVALVIRLFFPKHYPGSQESSWNSKLSSAKEWFDIPASLFLLLVVAPDFFAVTVKNGIVGIIICLVIGCYLLQEHIRASGGFKAAFTKSNGLSNSIGILLLFVYPAWALIFYFF